MDVVAGYEGIRVSCLYELHTYLAINPRSVHLYQVSTMVALCGRCGEPIRGFKGYDPEIGEICFTCYLEMLQKPGDHSEKASQTVPLVA